jgi:Cu2+-exporting ATPase
MMKDGGALERLAEVDASVFDKTGTLTTGSAVLQSVATLDGGEMRMAVALARSSGHPFSRAIAKAYPHIPDTVRLEDISEHPGLGVEGRSGGHTWRLGRASWATAPSEQTSATAGTALSKDGVMLASFEFFDDLRKDAVEAAAALRDEGIQLEILSGDRTSAVANVASLLSISAFSAGVLPVDKVNRLQHLKTSGARALMVGDGINDAPAMMAAHVSMAPASAADIGRSAADFIFLRESLRAVPLSLKVARHAERLVKQNFTLAIAYNLIAVPVAVMGHVTPLIAAIAMSGSSLLVIGNAMRLTAGEGWLKRHASIPWNSRKVMDA